MDSDLTFHADLAALAWQLDLGADVAVGETPVNRYEAVAVVAPAPVVPPPVARPGAATSAPVAAPAARDDGLAVRIATEAAARAPDLEALRGAMAAYEQCDL